MNHSKNYSHENFEILTKPVQKTMIPLVTQITSLIKRYQNYSLNHTSPSLNLASMTSSPSPTPSSRSETIVNSALKLSETIGDFCQMALALTTPLNGPALASAISRAKEASEEIERKICSTSRSSTASSPSTPTHPGAGTEGYPDSTCNCGEELQPDPGTDDISKSGERLLYALTRILVFADRATVHRVRDCVADLRSTLDDLYACDTFRTFIRIFGTFGQRMIQLAHLTSPRSLDLVDPDKRAYLEISRDTLEQCTPLILNTFKMALRQPESCDIRTLKGIVYDHVTRALDLVVKLLTTDRSGFLVCSEIRINSLASRKASRPESRYGARSLIRSLEESLYPRGSNRKTRQSDPSADPSSKLGLEALHRATQEFTDCPYVWDEDRVELIRTYGRIERRMKFLEEKKFAGQNRPGESSPLNGHSSPVPTSTTCKGTDNRIEIIDDLGALEHKMWAICQNLSQKLLDRRETNKVLLRDLFARTVVTDNHREVSREGDDHVTEFQDYVEQHIELIQLLSHVIPRTPRSRLGTRNSKSLSKSSNHLPVGAEAYDPLDNQISTDPTLYRLMTVATFCHQCLPLLWRICARASPNPNQVDVCTETLYVLLRTWTRFEVDFGTVCRVAPFSIQGTRHLCPSRAGTNGGCYLSLPRRGKHGSNLRRGRIPLGRLVEDFEIVRPISNDTEQNLDHVIGRDLSHAIAGLERLPIIRLGRGSPRCTDGTGSVQSSSGIGSPDLALDYYYGLMGIAISGLIGDMANALTGPRLEPNLADSVNRVCSRLGQIGRLATEMAHQIAPSSDRSDILEQVEKISLEQTSLRRLWNHSVVGEDQAPSEKVFKVNHTIRVLDVLASRVAALTYTCDKCVHITHQMSTPQSSRTTSCTSTDLSSIVKGHKERDSGES